jgi:hypothetical protein
MPLFSSSASDRLSITASAKYHGQGRLTGELLSSRKSVAVTTRTSASDFACDRNSVPVSAVPSTSRIELSMRNMLYRISALGNAKPRMIRGSSSARCDMINPWGIMAIVEPSAKRYGVCADPCRVLLPSIIRGRRLLNKRCLYKV